MTPLPAAAYELAVAPAALLLALVHASRALGPTRAAIEVGTLVAYGYALEWVGIRLFGAHDYGSAWRAAPGGVPLAVAAVWAAVIVAAAAIAARLGMARPLARAGTAAVLATALDLLMEPVAVRSGLWRWTPPGPWLGVPLGNFVGWMVVVCAWVLGLEHDRPDAAPRRAVARRVALAGAAILALAVVGLAWQALDAERAMSAAQGWALAALLWSSSVVLVLRARRPADAPSTVAERLGQARGVAPQAIFLLLLAAFAWNALARGLT